MTRTTASQTRIDSRWKSAAKAAGRSLSESGQSAMSDARSEAASRIGPVSYKRGGKVRKTGMARLHKGERVSSFHDLLDKMATREGRDLIRAHLEDADAAKSVKFWCSSRPTT